MRISGSGIARNGLRSLKVRKELSLAKDAISCLHDALLAVAKGMITPEQAQKFFWHNDLGSAHFIGGVLTFSEEHDDA